MTSPVIDDAPLIATQINAGDLEPTPAHARVLAEYIGRYDVDQAAHDVAFWKSESREHERKVGKLERVETDLKARLAKALDFVDELHGQTESIAIRCLGLKNELNP